MSALIRQSVSDYHEEKGISLQEIREPKELAAYLHKIQSYLLQYEAKNVPALLLRPYYAAFTNLARSTNPETVHLDCLQEKLGAAQRWQKKDQNVPSQRLSIKNNLIRRVKN